jgi:hypothetical protein
VARPRERGAGDVPRWQEVDVTASPSPIPPLADAELAALEEAVNHEALRVLFHGGTQQGTIEPALIRRLLAEVRAARESAARHEAEVTR